MYDRKTWIGLTLCSLALILHLFYSGKNRALKRTEKSLTEVKTEQSQHSSSTPTSSPTNTSSEALDTEQSSTEGGASPSEKESHHAIHTPSTIFHFTNKGGGLATSEIKKHKAVHDLTKTISINQSSQTPIGALASQPDSFVETLFKTVDSTDTSITYVGTTATGLQIRKQWSLLPKEDLGHDYRLKFTLTLKNPDQAPHAIDLANYSLFLGESAPLYQKEWENQTIWCYSSNDTFTQKHSSWFKGGFFGKPKSLYNELKEDVQYAGVSNQFFLSLLSPENPYDARIWAKSGSVRISEKAGGGAHEESKKSIRSGLSLPSKSLAPGELLTINYTLFTGPKENILIRDLKLGEAMNYGWFGFISNILNRLMNFLHGIFGGEQAKYSWGLSIIFVTVLIRIVIWPLHNKSQRTMKRMSKLKPKMDEIREKYSNDPTKMNQKTMALYRDYGVNPMGGCLPMLLQIPIFFGFYRMLQYAVELRGQPFLWVDDLSQPDTVHTFSLPFEFPFIGHELPINLLPILMALTMFLQMKLTPSTGDKMQQRIFMLMPFMFFFFCYNFASALALYWTTQNIFSIGQTLIMKLLPEPDLKKKKRKAGKGFMERLQEHAEAAQKQRQTLQHKKSGITAPKEKSKKPRGPRTGG